MQNSFSFQRFRKVLRKDFHRLFSQPRLLVGLALAMTVYLLSCAAMNEDHLVHLSDRVTEFFILIVVASTLSWSVICKGCTHPQQGVHFAMLPATAAEKYASIFVVSFLVAPLLTGLLAVAIDTLLVLLPFIPTEQFLWQMEGGVHFVNVMLVLSAALFGMAYMFLAFGMQCYGRSNALRYVLFLVVVILLTAAITFILCNEWSYLAAVTSVVLLLGCALVAWISIRRLRRQCY